MRVCVCTQVFLRTTPMNLAKRNALEANRKQWGIGYDPQNPQRLKTDLQVLPLSHSLSLSLSLSMSLCFCLWLCRWLCSCLPLAYVLISVSVPVSTAPCVRVHVRVSLTALRMLAAGASGARD